MKPETLLMIQKVSRKILPKEQTWEKFVISGRKANIQNKPAKQKKKPKTNPHHKCEEPSPQVTDILPRRLSG